MSYQLLLSVDDKKSPGPDDIPNMFLKRYASWMAKYLVVLFRKSLSEGVLPNDWLLAKVVPIHKSGRMESIDNYRPISLTCMTCKLLKHIITKHLTNYLTEYDILHPYQYGFRKGLSTVTQLVELYHYVSSASDSKTKVDALFLDLSKALARVVHMRLSVKLARMGEHFTPHK